jgi:hypothetical protein
VGGTQTTLENGIPLRRENCLKTRSIPLSAAPYQDGGPSFFPKETI